MILIQAGDNNSLLHRTDPRLRIFAAVIFSVIVVLSRGMSTIVLSLLYSLAAVVSAGLSLRMVASRVLKLNLFILVLLLFAERQARFEVLMIALKSNALLLWLSAFISTIDITSLGHALNHLRVPDKLTQLFLTTVRYIEVLFMEYRRLVQAMKIRAFSPAMTKHTYRAYSYLVGMLLVKSFDRAERISAAMKCRGFKGRFYIFKHFSWHRLDTTAGIVLGLMFMVMLCMEFMKI